MDHTLLLFTIHVSFWNPGIALIIGGLNNEEDHAKIKIN